MDLADLQMIYAEQQASNMEVRELHQELETVTARWHKASAKNTQLHHQQRQMIKFIAQTQEFYRFIVVREWRPNATDRDMVMAFLSHYQED